MSRRGPTRMTSQHLKLTLETGAAVSALLLRPAGARACFERADHLAEVKIPMLFLQGTRDEFADLSLLQPLIKELGSFASLHVIHHGDHSLHVPARFGRNKQGAVVEVLDTLVSWIVHLPD